MSDYKNDYNKFHYDRINLMVPQGKKEEIKKIAASRKMSVNEYIWSAVLKDMHDADALPIIDISNRRYVGGKQSLLPFVRNSLKNISIHSIADLFSGTGVVAGAFNAQNRIVITNDILYSNYICHYAWFSSEKYDEKMVREKLIQYNSLPILHEENYVTENYAGRYFSCENASKIGYIREDIERLKNNNEINQREYALLLMSLLYATQHADVSRTIGHYMTFLKKNTKDGNLKLCMPLAPSPRINLGNQCYNIDASILIKSMPPVDLLYIDPPYHRQYGEYYHVLESIAMWNKATTYGNTRRIVTTKSNFSIKTKATRALAEIVEETAQRHKAKYILLSYNNDPRNNMQSIDIMQILSRFGKTRVFNQEYPSFHGRNNKQNTDNKERLFLCVLQ